MARKREVLPPIAPLLCAGPSTEGGWRQTVSNLGQGESFPLAFPT